MSASVMGSTCSMIRNAAPYVLLIIGWLLVTLGAFLCLAGNALPYPDPTPELLSKQATKAQIWHAVFQLGVLTTAGGGILIWLRSRAKTMIRRVRIQEANILTKISFSSKGYWNYPKEFFEKWSNELTISSDYIQNNAVFVFEKDGNIIGYYSIVELKDDIEIADIKINKGFWLEHMFIEPQSIGKGIGTKLFQHLRKWCTSLDVSELGILADPHSRGFYEKMGCEYMLEYPSTIKNRTTPYFQLKITKR